MKNGRLLFAAISLVSLSVATHAQVAPNAGPPVVKEKKTCRQLTPTGSMMSSRVCNTAAGWQKFEAIGAEGVNDFRRATQMSTTRGKDS